MNLDQNLSITVKKISGWNWALDGARKTINKTCVEKEPSNEFKIRILYPEHSPIRTVRYWIDIKNIKRWVSGHLVRHNQGISHFVGTQRTDRTGINRDLLLQSEPSDHSMDVNAAEIIYISRKRLCNKASAETKEVWKKVITEIGKIDPELKSVCVPECVYRGFCPESVPCIFSRTTRFKNDREQYVNRCIQHRL